MTQEAPLYMGIMSTATSVGITARILSEKKKMDSEEGTTIMAGAVIDDSRRFNTERNVDNGSVCPRNVSTDIQHDE